MTNWIWGVGFEVTFKSDIDNRVHVLPFPGWEGSEKGQMAQKEEGPHLDLRRVAEEPGSGPTKTPRHPQLHQDRG